MASNAITFSATDFRELTDCHFYLQGKCDKDLTCPYRHHSPAKRTSTICNNWQIKSCKDVFCNMRHPAIKKGSQIGSPPAFLSSQPLPQKSFHAFPSSQPLPQKSFHAFPSSQPLPQKSFHGTVHNGSTHGDNINRKLLLLKNFDPSLNQEAIKKFIHDITALDVVSVNFSHDRLSAIVKLQSKLKTEAAELKNHSLFSKLGSKVELLPCSFVTQVLVTDLPVKISKYEIEKEVRAKTGPLSIQDVQLSHNYAIITFKKSSDAAELVKERLQISGDLYHCLFFNEQFITDDIHMIMFGNQEDFEKVKETIASYIDGKGPFDAKSIKGLLETEKGKSLLMAAREQTTVWKKLVKGEMSCEINIKQDSIKIRSKAEIELIQTNAFRNQREELRRELCVESKFLDGQDPVPKRMSLAYAYASVPAYSISMAFVVGDIGEEQADVIVNSTGVPLLSGNASSESLFKADGNGGNLHCKKVYHVYLGHFNPQRLQELILKVLENASCEGFNSVAFPLLGNWTLSYGQDAVLQAFQKSVEHFSQQSKTPCINLIKIVASSEDKVSIGACKSFFEAQVQSTYGTPKAYGEVCFVGFSLDDVSAAMAMVRKFLKMNFTTETYTVSALQDYSEGEKTALSLFASDNDVTIEISKDGQLTLKGTPERRTMVVDYILKQKVKGSISLPKDWKPMPKDLKGEELMCYQEPLEVESKAFKYVRHLVLSEAEGTSIEIENIWRIQNPTLFAQYKLRKQAMDKTNKTNHNSRELFHGTLKENTEEINCRGFGRIFAGRNEASFGDGNYFATSSKFAQQSGDGYCYMYVVLVLVGDFTIGKKGMKTTPIKCQTSGSKVRYDSLVDNVIDPTIFVVFPDNQMYPAFLIRFKLM